jgi:hypothetical protein
MTRAVAGMVIALAAVGVAGADNSGNQDEFKVVVASGLEGRWAIEGATIGETHVVFSFIPRDMLFMPGISRYVQKDGKGQEVENGMYAVRRPGEIDIRYT